MTGSRRPARWGFLVGVPLPLSIAIAARSFAMARALCRALAAAAMGDFDAHVCICITSRSIDDVLHRLYLAGHEKKMGPTTVTSLDL